MSREDFSRQFTLWQQTYGSSNAEAGARREQSLAKLFVSSGWTQEELAAEVGKSQTWVVFQLRFGRFIANFENITTVINLNERRFRQYWDDTGDVRENEGARFRAIARMVEANGTPIGKLVGEVVREHFVDNKWHSVSVIAKRANQPVEKVNAALGNMFANQAKSKYTIERKKVARDWHYRWFNRSKKTVSAEELVEKLSPLIDELRSQARTNMATVDISTFGHVASQLRKLLEEWTQ